MIKVTVFRLVNCAQKCALMAPAFLKNQARKTIAWMIENEPVITWLVIFILASSLIGHIEMSAP